MVAAAPPPHLMRRLAAELRVMPTTNLEPKDELPCRPPSGLPDRRYALHRWASPSSPSMSCAPHALNDEMEAAGVLKFACGISPVGSARTPRPQPDGKMLVTDGPYTETKEHIGGFYLLDAADMDEVLGWLRKVAVAFRGPVEVRQIMARQSAD